MSKKNLFLLLIFAFLSFTQISYAQDSLLSTEEQISDASAAVSTEEPPVAESSASSLSKVPVANKTVAVSIEEQISNASVAVSTEEPPATEPTASSLSKVLVANKTVAVSTEEQISNASAAVSTEAQISNASAAVSTEAQISNASAAVSTEEPPVAVPTASSLSKVLVANKIVALSTEEQISNASVAVSTEEPPATEPTASSLSKVPVANKTVALSTEAQISNASAAVSTEEPPVAESSASSLSKVLVANKTVAVSTEEQISNDKCELNVAKSSANSITQVQNQTSENEISKSVKSQESFVGKNIFSFELAYLRNALKNNGWGIGLSFEQSLFQFFSIKGRFSHVTMFPKDLDFNITTVGIGAEVLFYPFRNGLDKLYFGFGNETDFYMYLSNSPENSKDTIITIYPKIGWKQNFFNLIFLDLFVSYNIFLSEVPTLSSNINLLERGINYGAKFKFNLSDIWTFVKNRFSS